MKVWIDRAGYDGLRCLRKKRSDAAKLKSGNSKSDSSASTAMSEITMQRNYSTTHMLHAALKGIQTTSFITPPALLAITLYRHSSIRPLLHPTALLRHLSFASLGVGVPLGLAYGVVTTPKGPLAAVTAGIKEKTIGLTQTELNFRDYSVIGGVIGALLTTTVFLRRVPIVWNVVGGSTIGIAAGTTFAGYKSL